MSFSLDKNVALNFMNRVETNYNKKKVLYILKKGEEYDNKNATNADLAGISAFGTEKEILFFPFSVYEINKIENHYTHYEIYLNYLGKYKKLFNFKSNQELFNSLTNTKFVQDLRKSGFSAIPNDLYLKEDTNYMDNIELSDKLNIEKIKNGINYTYGDIGGIETLFCTKYLYGKKFGIEEFEILFNYLGINDIDKDRVKNLIKIFDEDGDGKLSQQEFRNLYNYK